MTRFVEGGAFRRAPGVDGVIDLKAVGASDTERDPVLEAGRRRLKAQHSRAFQLIERIEQASDGLVGPVGLDGVVGLIPGVGAAYSIGAGLAIISIAGSAGVSFLTLLKMVGVIVIDVVIGAVLGIGDLVDFFFRGHAIIGRMAREALLDADARDAACASAASHSISSLLPWLKGLAVVAGLFLLLHACAA